jgi:hypothetical protein
MHKKKKKRFGLVYALYYYGLYFKKCDKCPTFSLTHSFPLNEMESILFQVKEEIKIFFRFQVKLRGSIS